MLGILNPQNSPFSNVLFSSISSDSQHMAYADYLTWLLVSKYGSDDEKYRIGFRLCDSFNRKSFSKDELMFLLNAMMHVLTEGLQFEAFDYTEFVDEFWSRLDQVLNKIRFTNMYQYFHNN